MTTPNEKTKEKCECDCHKTITGSLWCSDCWKLPPHEIDRIRREQDRGCSHLHRPCHKENPPTDEKGKKCIHGHIYTNCVFCMVPNHPTLGREKKAEKDNGWEEFSDKFDKYVKEGELQFNISSYGVKLVKAYIKSLPSQSHNEYVKELEGEIREIRKKHERKPYHGMRDLHVLEAIDEVLSLLGTKLKSLLVNGFKV